MNLGAEPSTYCRVCGTGHIGRSTCPGELPATGAERPGWRINIETPAGHEAIGVLLAPSHDQWRARIVTFPNVLWSAPGGRGTLKFVGNTREEAEAQARLFVERHVEAKRSPRRDGVALVYANLPKTPGGSARPPIAVAPRKASRLPVRFGLDGLLVRGVTVNVSCDGMFVGLGSPADSGRSLLLHLDLHGHTLSLNGLVMWNRDHAEPGRPVGMGVRLSEPPPIYQSFVDSLP